MSSRVLQIRDASVSDFVIDLCGGFGAGRA
jgi:hypothetical protein